jgi:hypothetical protein
MMFVLALFFVALAVWSIVTLVGLIRMRYWARYSVLVIAGCVAFFAGTGSLFSFAMPFLASSIAPPTPGASPALMHGVFFVVGAFYALFAAVGIALLVYFNLAGTRQLFQQNAPVNLAPPNTITGRPRPTAVTVISWFYLISAPFCLIYFSLPFPAFLFGFIFYGLAAHLVYALFGVLTFTIGYGLLRLHNSARIAVFVMFFICPIQMLVVLTPWGSHHFHLYMSTLNARMYAGQPAPPNFFFSTGAIIFFTFIGMAGYGVVLWLLHRHREAFTPAPLVPPLPMDPDPLAG